MDEDQQPPSPEALTTSAVVFYGVMALVGTWLISAQGLDPILIIFGDGTEVARDTLLGAISGLAVVGLTRLSLRFEAVRALNAELSEMLGEPGAGTITALAISSSIGEELLFRGALQPLIGFLPTALLFALLHGGFNARLRLWAIFALLAGFLLGGLTLFTDNLLAAILCHLTVNYFNLHTVVSEESTP